MSFAKSTLPTDEEANLPIFEDGPTKGQVDAWKKQFGNIYMSEVDETTSYIWKVLRRSEFKEVMANEAITALDREDLICKACVLWPSEPDLAGVPTILAEQILDKSGFVSKGGPVKL